MFSRKMSLLALLAALAAGVSATTALADPPPWAPAHGWRHKHERVVVRHYDYYPSRRVYVDPVDDRWYWREGGHWRSSEVRPVIFTDIDLGTPIVVDFDD